MRPINNQTLDLKLHRPVTIMDVFAETSKDLILFPEGLSQARFKSLLHSTLVLCLVRVGDKVTLSSSVNGSTASLV